MTSPLLLLLAAALCACLPIATLGDTTHEPEDRFVSRDRAYDDEAFVRGKLGVLLPSFGRKTLYAAYRVLTLPPGATASESHARRGETAASQQDAIDAWLKVRAQVRRDGPPARIDYFKPYGKGMLGSFGNCGGNAFETAARLLTSMRANKAISPNDIQAWVDGQDAVFAYCAAGASDLASISLSGTLPDDATPLMRALRQYQQAAALFYRGDFEAAIARFDAIVAEAGHPMRRLAALGTLRAIVRSASLDLEWDIAFRQAYAERGLRGEALSAALAGPRARKRELDLGAQRRLEVRAAELAKNPELAPMAPLFHQVVIRGATQFVPDRMLASLFAELDQTARNPYPDDTIERWDRLYRMVLPSRFGGTQAEPLRRAHVFFDWLLTIQGCNDDPRNPAPDTLCATEHARALARWQSERSTAWLTATLVTMRSPAAEDSSAIEAALKVAVADPAWATLQYHAGRALRMLGRRGDARTLSDGTLAAPGLDASTKNLLRQERFALAQSLTDAARHAMRSIGHGEPDAIGADAAELFDNRLASDDLLLLARDEKLPSALRERLAAAAWYRADLAQRAEIAVAAAKLTATLTPVLANAATRYAGADSGDERREIILLTATSYQFSPILFQTETFRPGARLSRNQPLAANWCGFGSTLHKRQQAVERAPELPAELRGSPGQAQEFERLKEMGNGPAWFARQAILAARRRVGDPASTLALLRQVVFLTSADLPCPIEGAAFLRAQAQQMLDKR